MVITTMELIQLLYDAIVLRDSDNIDINSPPNNQPVPDKEMYDVVRRTIRSVPTTITTVPHAMEHMPIVVDCTTLATCHFRYATKNTFMEMLQQQVNQYVEHGRPYLLTMSVPTESKATASTVTSPRNVTGSGGYADYIFRFVVKQIYDVECPKDTSIWIPIMDDGENRNHRHGGDGGDGTRSIVTDSTSNGMTSVRRPMRMSARAANQRKQREYYEAMLLQNHQTQEYYVATTATTSSEMKNDCTIVLRFVIAYGMPLVQSVLSKLTTARNDIDCTKQKRRLDYIECMACAHSCLNGNGQLRSTANDHAVVLRETPSDIKQRVHTAYKYFPIQQHHALVTRQDSTNCTDDDMMINTPNVDLYQNDPSFYTRYHIVPPMQHTMGVAAGVSVQDTVW
jgi:hypothetical protein